MKQITLRHLVLAAILAVLAHAAQALPSYSVSVATKAYEEAKESGTAGVGGYSGYYCTIEQAQKLFGGTTVSAIESYMDRHFSTTASGTIPFESVSFSDGQYGLVTYTETGFTDSDYVALAFYGNEAYRVFAAGSAMLTPYSQIVFDDQKSTVGTFGEWRTVPEQGIPEPTSGVLLALGLAGLALRRKRG